MSQKRIRFYWYEGPYVFYYSRESMARVPGANGYARQLRKDA